jgi:hypothetical protein
MKYEIIIQTDSETQTIHIRGVTDFVVAIGMLEFALTEVKSAMEKSVQARKEMMIRSKVEQTMKELKERYG